jgi:hypothetical protein
MRALQRYLHSNFNIDENTSATIIITISIFIAGIVIQQILSMSSGIIKRKRIRKLFAINVKNFVNEVKKQEEAYLKTSESFKFETGLIFSFTRSPIFSHKSILEMGYQISYESFFYGIENIFKFKRDKKLKAFRTIWSSVHSVDYWHDKTFTEINKFQEKTDEFNNRWNNAIGSHRQFIDSIMAEVNGQLLQKELGVYLKEVDKIHLNWQNLPNRTRPDILNKNLIIPLRILNRKHQNNISLKMNDNLLAAGIEFQNKRNLFNAQKDLFSNYARSFRLNYRLTRISIKILNNFC